jgi:hypothetical protein
VGEDILEVLLGLGEGESLDCLGGLVGILVMDPEVPACALGNYISRMLPLEVEGFLE